MRAAGADAAAAHEQQLQREREAIAEAQRELDELGPEPSALPAEDLSAAEQRAAAAEERAADARAAVGKVAAAVETAEAGRTRIAALHAALLEHETAFANWTRLAQDLGRDGLQAMEIDAAIPELNAIANGLLHECFGPRFTVELSTTQLDAKGKREIEGLYVRVLDTKSGREDELSTYSGGEKVIVAEAIALALTTVACRYAGLNGPTLVRDESGAALDAANGRAYIAMLRQASKLIGASKTFFVSHNPELSELADARLEVLDGKVSVIA
jgi:exonuclease SbcC